MHFIKVFTNDDSYIKRGDYQDTLINITNHSYFNLTGCKENIYNHVLELKADRFACVDNDGLPNGEIRCIENKPFDFRSVFDEKGNFKT